MILVTVGTTMFDNLIKSVDELVSDKKIKEKVYCQIGRGNYIPKNCDYFKFDSKIDENYYKKCKLIICVDSAGTMFRNLELGNKIIAVRHPTTKGALDLGQKLSQDNYIFFIEKYSSIKELKEKVVNLFLKVNKLKKYNYKKKDITKEIINYIEGL